MRVTARRVLNSFVVLLFLAAGTACAAQAPEPKVVTKDLVVGDGTEVTAYATVQVHYTGWLEDGTQFDSSRDRGQPFELQVGAGQVIPGWEIGLEGMKAGGKRELIIPPELAYGARGAGDVIPPNARLKFVVEVIAVEPPPFTNIDNAQLKKKLAEGVKIVDIRRPDEWKETGVIEGSILLTAFDEKGRFVRSFPSEFTKTVATDEEVILICRTGRRSSALANALVNQAGYSRVLNVKDGIPRWLAEGGAVVKP